MNKLKRSEHNCDFCNKSFVKESSLINHLCVKKQRWLDKDTKWATLGFYTYKRFYQLTRSLHKKTITVSAFIESKHYNDFIKLGRFLSNFNIIKPEQYIDFLIKNSIKVKDWCTDFMYEKYIKEIINNEDPHNGIERSILYLQSWAEDQSKEIQSFFKECNVNVAVNAIRVGRISPWLIYLAPKSSELLDRFDDSQLKLIQNFIDPKVWQIKKSRYKKECKEIKSLLIKFNL